jgi:hypothetical protein
MWNFVSKIKSARHRDSMHNSKCNTVYVPVCTLFQEQFCVQYMMIHHNTCILLGRPLLPAFWILGTFYGCNFPSERKTKIWIMCSFPETVQFPTSYALKHSNEIFSISNTVTEALRPLEETLLVPLILGVPSPQFHHPLWKLSSVDIYILNWFRVGLWRT